MTGSPSAFQCLACVWQGCFWVLSSTSDLRTEHPGYTYRVDCDCLTCQKPRAALPGQVKPGQIWWKWRALLEDLWLHFSVSAGKGPVIPGALAASLNKTLRTQGSKSSPSTPLIYSVLNKLSWLISEIMERRVTKRFLDFKKICLSFSHFLIWSSQEPLRLLLLLHDSPCAVDNRTGSVEGLFKFLLNAHHCLGNCKYHLSLSSHTALGVDAAAG